MIHTQDADFTLLNCDVLEGLRTLPDESIHCCITSPPYWGLRCYGVDGQYGLEPTPELYIARMVEVFREVRRVLRADGTCWVNLGDSYASNSATGTVVGDAGRGSDTPTMNAEYQHRVAYRGGGIKAKDLCGIPWRVAFALQADGWYLRSDIIWAKPNPMPESVTDRPTKAHEYVFLLSKSAKYFFDQEAVREPHLPQSLERWKPGTPRIESEREGKNNELNRQMREKGISGNGPMITAKSGQMMNPSGRNVRSVWDIPTQPYPEAHFATYPEELVRRCVLAGSSERGCCPVCGKPWERETTVEQIKTSSTKGRATQKPNDHNWDGVQACTRKSVTTLGWHPGCDCPYASLDESQTFVEWGDFRAPIPCTILDPFLGSGTTAFVARKHGRRSIGIELNPAYADLAARRMQQQSLLV